ncbi:MAG TPA: NUDIX hydrolase [Gaiellales bacterium]|jgi:8-oxo-dGTP pyrophosphatase MutT (NUDIX family)|nr:NUDIX hydrolase [Gaiellales bacterium]
MEPAPADNIVRAAGAVLVDGERVALVHRPRYDDWTLPKGKNEPGEDDIAAALREVQEETGFHGRIERDLGVVRYTVEKHGAVLPKIVRYYVMAVGGGAFEPNHEVDELRWVTREQAAQLLTYERDREVLARW